MGSLPSPGRSRVYPSFDERYCSIAAAASAGSLPPPICCASAATRGSRFVGTSRSTAIQGGYCVRRRRNRSSEGSSALTVTT